MIPELWFTKNGFLSPDFLISIGQSIRLFLLSDSWTTQMHSFEISKIYIHEPSAIFLFRVGEPHGSENILEFLNYCI